MRILGGMLILCGSMGLGLWYRDRLKGRVKAQLSLIRLLELFRSEIRYGKIGLPESCRALAEQMAEPYRSGLQKTYRVYLDTRMNGQGSFQNVFCAEMDKCLQELPLRTEDREAFLGAFQSRGFQDGEMQLKCLEQGIEQLRTYAGLAQEELPGKCRLALALGGMSGLLLVTVLL